MGDFDTEGEDELDPFGGSSSSTESGSRSPTTSSTKRSVVEQPDKNVRKTTPRAGPPSVDEWQDFIGRIVLRTVFDGYMTLMLRDIELSEQEERYLHLSKQDLKEMSAPLAGFANKNKTLRKHGRSIVDAADSWESIVAISIWLRRVNRVARRHAPELAAARKNRTRDSRRRNDRASPAQTPTPITSAPSMNGGSANGNPRQDEGNGSRIRRPSSWRPPPADVTFNPGSG